MVQEAWEPAGQQELALDLTMFWEGEVLRCAQPCLLAASVPQLDSEEAWAYSVEREAAHPAVGDRVVAVDCLDNVWSAQNCQRMEVWPHFEGQIPPVGATQPSSHSYD